jgi:hypothetical protein
VVDVLAEVVDGAAEEPLAAGCGVPRRVNGVRFWMVLTFSRRSAPAPHARILVDAIQTLIINAEAV